MRLTIRSRHKRRDVTAAKTRGGVRPDGRDTNSPLATPDLSRLGLGQKQLTVLTALALTVAACVASRLAMSTTNFHFTHANLVRLFEVAPGAILDAILGAICLAVAVHPRSRPVGRCLGFGAWLAVVLLQGLDTVLFAASSDRLTAVVIDHLNFVSIRVYVSHTISSLGFTDAALCLLVVTSMAVLARAIWRTSSTAGSSLAAAVALLLCIVYIPAHYESEQQLSRDHYPSGAFFDALIGQQKRARRSAAANFTEILWSNPTRDFDSISARDLDLQERALLAGVVPSIATHPDPRQLQLPRLKRVIVILVESLARDYLPKFNPRMPPDTLTNLNRWVDEYPFFSNLWTSNLPTYEGMYALFASRPHLNLDAAALCR